MAWSGEVLGEAARELSLSPSDRAVLCAEDGSLIEERALRLGPLGLFGVRSSPLVETAAPTVVFLNAGLIPHVGPGRLWVTLACRLAAAGIPALRVDLSGLGESPVRPGQRAQIDYPLEALDDVAAIVDAVSPGDPSGVVLAGLCAGAYHSIEAGIALGVRAVYAINPILNFDPPEVREGGELAPGRNAVRPHNRWIKVLLGHRGLVDFGDRHVPPLVWALLQRLHLHCSPARGLEELAEREVWTMLVCGDMEARQFERRAWAATRRLEAEGKLRLARLADSDHSLFGAAARAVAAELVAGSLVSRYVPAPPEPSRSRWARSRHHLHRLTHPARSDEFVDERLQLAQVAALEHAVAVRRVRPDDRVPAPPVGARLGVEPVHAPRPAGRGRRAPTPPRRGSCSYRRRGSGRSSGR